MRSFRADDSFYPSPRLAMQAPPETLAYVSLANPSRRDRPDALGVVDLDSRSRDYGTLVGQVDMPHAGDEIRHIGWNACSSSLGPFVARANLERRYLIVPGLRSSRIHIVDTRPDARNPRVVKVIEPDTLARLTGYARPAAARSTPEGIYVTALGAPDGGGPGGLFLLDPETFDVRGRWELDRGPQYVAGDLGLHLGQDTLVTAEWGTPRMIDGGLTLDTFRADGYGHRVHIWDRRRRSHLEALDLGPEQQMVFAVRPAHDPTRSYGFAAVGASSRDLSASIWLWHAAGRGAEKRWEASKIIEIPAEAADPGSLPDVLRPFGVVPPLVTNLTLSLDDRHLYVSCWGTGELRQYDVTNPFDPRLTASVRLGGIGRRHPHPSRPDEPLDGGPQTTVVSRDGRRLYVTNSLSVDWDEQFHPGGLRGWLALVDLPPAGGMRLDTGRLLTLDGWRPHDLRLDGGDASSDSFCFP